MKYGVQLVLPGEVVEHLPADPKNWVPYLKAFFEEHVIKPYEVGLQRRQSGFLAQPLSRYERTAYLDLLIDMVLGSLREKIEGRTEASVELSA